MAELRPFKTYTEVQKQSTLAQKVGVAHALRDCTSDSKKFSISKKGIGIEGEKSLKQVRGQKQVREWKQAKDRAKGSLYVE